MLGSGRSVEDWEIPDDAWALQLVCDSWITVAVSGIIVVSAWALVSYESVVS